jgi:hypothetical protein
VQYAGSAQGTGLVPQAASNKDWRMARHPRSTAGRSFWPLGSSNKSDQLSFLPRFSTAKHSRHVQDSCFTRLLFALVVVSASSCAPAVARETKNKSRGQPSCAKPDNKNLCVCSLLGAGACQSQSPVVLRVVQSMNQSIINKLN